MRLRILTTSRQGPTGSVRLGRLLSRRAFSVLVLAALCCAAPAAGADGFVLLRNAKNTTASISAADVKGMAIGKKKTWPGGAVVMMVLPPVGSPELGWFASTISGVSDSALMAKIKQEVFKGELRKPVIAASAKEVIDAVAADEGALGIVAASVAQALPPSVATIAVK